MNTTTIIRQIKEYMGAYGKAYTLLYLGAVTILTSCVKDDLYDTPHPDRGAVVVTTDWSGKSTEADIPQAYTLRIGGREQNVSAATNVFDALLAPGGYGLTMYNSPEGISIDGNKATVNPVDLTGAIEPHPGYLFASHQDISVVADDTLHVTAPMRQRAQARHRTDRHGRRLQPCTVGYGNALRRGFGSGYGNRRPECSGTSNKRFQAGRQQVHNLFPTARHRPDGNAYADGGHHFQQR